MRTIQMTLDGDLVKAVDAVAKRLHTTRSAFTRTALRDALQRHRAMELEARHREGYRKKPARENEFAVWESEHRWGDE